MWHPPIVERFTDALLMTDGAAGFDGWGKAEMRALIAHAPWLIAELHAVLVRLTREAPTAFPPNYVTLYSRGAL